MRQPYLVRNARPDEFLQVGKLMVRAYSQLEGFPKETEIPRYYQILANVGELTKQPGMELLVAISPQGSIDGAVVYVDDMKYYGSPGTAPNASNAAGFRLLAVDPATRGKGAGKLLCLECIDKAKASARKQLIIHTTAPMQIAWKMYENLGFQRAGEYDFMQGDLAIFGFRLVL
jgi:ribosomal protein S18 acetylase RimI-like enzyme